MPSLTSGWPSFALVDAIRIVQAIASSQPPPSTKPLMAAMTGLPSVSMRVVIAWPIRACSRPVTGVSFESSAMSAPATNAFGPAPVRTTARTCGFFPASETARSRSASTSDESAFNLSGRSIVRIATPSETSFRTNDIGGSLSKRVGFLSIAFFVVAVEAPPGLAAELAGEHHLLHKRRRRETFLAILVEHDLADVVGRVDPDEIEQRERTHRMGAAELHSAVDVRNRPDPLFQRADRVEEIRDEQPVDDEAGIVAGGDRLLAERPRELHHLPVGRIARDDRSHDFDELHHGHGVEEMQTRELLRPLRRHRHLDDRQRRGVRAEDRLRLARPVECRVRLLLQIEILDDRLDHHVA